jgi:hypothetical protein
MSIRRPLLSAPYPQAFELVGALLDLGFEQRRAVGTNVNLARQDLAGGLARALDADFVAERNRFDAGELALPPGRVVCDHALTVYDERARVFPLGIAIELDGRATRGSTLRRHVSGAGQEADGEDAGENDCKCAIAVVHVRTPEYVQRMASSSTSKTSIPWGPLRP